MANERRTPPVLSDWRVQRYLEWLCTPADDRQPSNQREMAEVLSVHFTTLSYWKKDPDFLAAWEALYRKTVGAPDRIQMVLDRLYQSAIDRSDPRQVQAAKAYLEAVDAARPKKAPVTTAKAARELTNDQLMAILAERAEQEMAQRG